MHGRTWQLETFSYANPPSPRGRTTGDYGQEPIAKHMNAIAFVDGERITHLHGEENWIEVSGFKAERSFLS